MHRYVFRLVRRIDVGLFPGDVVELDEGVAVSPAQPDVVVRRPADAGVEVVNLIDQSLVSEDIQSDEGERAVVVMSIYADVFARHEANIGGPEEGCLVDAACACSRAAGEVTDADEAVEVGDRRGIALAALDAVMQVRHRLRVRGREIDEPRIGRQRERQCL